MTVRSSAVYNINILALLLLHVWLPPPFPALLQPPPPPYPSPRHKIPIPPTSFSPVQHYSQKMRYAFSNPYLSTMGQKSSPLGFSWILTHLSSNLQAVKYEHKERRLRVREQLLGRGAEELHSTAQQQEYVSSDTVGSSPPLAHTLTRRFARLLVCSFAPPSLTPQLEVLADFISHFSRLLLDPQRVVGASAVVSEPAEALSVQFADIIELLIFVEGEGAEAVCVCVCVFLVC